MLSGTFLLLISQAFFMLRLGNGTAGSFPRPLKVEEEQRCVELWVEKGDLEARNILIEHNLRLVAHIIKKGYPSRRDFLGMFKKFEIFR